MKSRFLFPVQVDTYHRHDQAPFSIIVSKLSLTSPLIEKSRQDTKSSALKSRGHKPTTRAPSQHDLIIKHANPVEQKNVRQEQKEIFTKQNNEKKEQINPFGPLRLPDYVLSENLFPRKYLATFMVFPGSEIAETVELLKLVSLSKENSSHLDQIVKEAFLYQLQEQDSSQLLKWAHTFPLDRRASTFEVVLEFHGAN